VKREEGGVKREEGRGKREGGRRARSEVPMSAFEGSCLPEGNVKP
jgi:hypothetical protein